MIYITEVDTTITKIPFNKEEYIVKKVNNFNPSDKWHGTPESYLSNYWGTLKVKNGYYYFTHSWITEDIEESYFYDEFIGTKEELSTFIKELYEALCIKYNNYLIKKKENNYKSIIGKIKKLSPEEIKNLKEFISNYKFK